MRLRTHVDCAGDSTQEFVFEREGVLGHAPNADAVFDGDSIDFRAPVPGFNLVEGVLTRNSDGTYSGSRTIGQAVGQPCAGSILTMTFTATFDGR